MVGLISNGSRLFACLLNIAAFVLRASAAEQSLPTLVDVFVNGDDGYPAYRIPALITTKRGALLAFAEGRASLRDHAENGRHMKISVNSVCSCSSAE
jgi:hypothetical protein